MPSKNVCSFLILFALAPAVGAMTSTGKDLVSHEKDHMASPASGASPTSWLRASPADSNVREVSTAVSDASCVGSSAFSDVSSCVSQPGK